MKNWTPKEREAWRPRTPEQREAVRLFWHGGRSQGCTSGVPPMCEARCKYGPICTLCDHRPAADPPPTGTPPAPTRPSAAPKPAAVFAVQLERDPLAWVGTLRISGHVDEMNIAPALTDLGAALPTLDGLFVVFDSPGGSFLAGDMLEAGILKAKQHAPVVAWINDARSTCAIPAAASDLCFAAPSAALGGFGQMLHACDGRRPIIMTNRQSPEKYDGTPLAWPPRTKIATDADHARLQEILDRQYERDLLLIARYCGTDPDALRPHLDGSTLTAQEALAAGLVTAIAEQRTAYAVLLNLITPQHRKEE